MCYLHYVFCQQRKVHGDCQWGMYEGREADGSVQVEDIPSTSSSHIFWGFISVGHTVHSKRLNSFKFSVLLWSYIRNGCAHSVKQKIYIYGGFILTNLLNSSGKSVLSLDQKTRGYEDTDHSWNTGFLLSNTPNDCVLWWYCSWSCRRRLSYFEYSELAQNTLKRHTSANAHKLLGHNYRDYHYQLNNSQY